MPVPDEELSLDELVSKLTDARAAWDEAQMAHQEARSRESAARTAELTAGKVYNGLLEKLNKEFGSVRI